MLRQRDCAIYIYDIPVDILQKICKTLDVDKGWQELAAKCGYSFDAVKLFDLEYYRPHGSPTMTLIGDWGVKNPTILDFYEKLKTIERIREMRLLEPLLKAAREHEKLQAELREAERLIEVQEQIDRDNQSRDSEELGKACKGNQAGATKPVSQYPQNQLDDNKHNYESLNLDKTTQNRATKASGKKKLGISLESTKVYDRCYQNVNAQDMNESRVENREDEVNEESGAKGSNKCRSSVDGDLGLLLSDGERASAMSLTPSQGEIEKDIAVAVSATASFTYKDLSQATDGFSDGNKIGEGAFGNVYRGVLKNSRCAVKRLKQTEQWKKSKDQLTHNASEIKSLMRYRHENIVQLYGFSIDEDELCLVYQYMHNGSMEDRLQCRDNTLPLTWLRRINILRGAACGIQYLHTMDAQKPLIHGDIKSPNILLDRHFEAKISDLGLAEYANAGEVTGMYTHITKKGMDSKMYSSKAYLPPEYHSNGPSTKSDTYGFGVIILETCTGEKAYDEKREGERFLAPYSSTLMEEIPEEDWTKHLIDKRAGPCPNPIHHLLKLASKCISNRKKDRPVMTDTLKQLEWICDQWNAIPTPSGESLPTVVQEASCVNNQNNPEIPQNAESPMCKELNRKMSLPCYPTTPKLAISPLMKSQSLDEEPESLRLQRKYDLQEKIKELGRVFSEQVETTAESANDVTVLTCMRVDPAAADVPFSETVKADNLPNLGQFSDKGHCNTPDTDVQTEEAYDVQTEEAYDVQTEEAYAEQKLKEMKLFDDQNMSGHPKDDLNCPGDAEGSDNNNSGIGDSDSQQDQQLQTESAGINQDDQISSFIKNYVKALAKYEEGQDQVLEGQGETAAQEMVYCGINIIEGKPMALLLDPSTEQHYAVDPSTLDPVFYHQQQVQYYTEYQTAIKHNTSSHSESNA